MNIIREKGKSFLLAFLNIGLFYALPILFSSFIPSFVVNGSNLIKDITLLIIELLVTLTLICVNLNLLKQDFKTFKQNFKQYLNEGFKYYFIGLFLMIISNLIIVSINSGNIANNEEVNRDVLLMYPLYASLSIAILGPISEELTFRGGFKKAFKNIVCYTIFTGLLFGGAHIIGNVNAFADLLYLIPYCTLGLTFSYICYKTNNIFTSITIHSLHNCFSLFIILLGGLL